MSLIFTVLNSWLKLLADSSGWHQRLLEWPRSSSQWSGGAWFTTKSQTAKPATHATCRNHDETDERNESGKLDNNAYCLWTANLSSNPAYLLGISHIIVWWGILCPQGLGSCGNLQSIALLKSVSAPKGQEMWYSCWCASAMPAILHAACHMLHASSWYHYCRCCCWWWLWWWWRWRLWCSWWGSWWLLWRWEDQVEEWGDVPIWQYWDDLWVLPRAEDADFRSLSSTRPLGAAGKDFDRPGGGYLW